MDKNIGPSSHNTAVYEWTKNFGRSMGQLSIRALGSMAPTISSTIGAVRSTSQEARMTLREFNIIDKKNKIVKSANTIFNEALEDIRTGDFNVTRYADDLYDDFDDELGDSFDIFDNEGSEKTQSQITADSSAGIAKSVIQTGAAEIDSLNQMSKNITSTYINGSRAMSRELKGTMIASMTMLNRHLSGVNSRLDAINNNIGLLVEFNRTNVYEKDQKLLDYMEKTSSMINEMGKMLAATTDAVEGKRNDNRPKSASDVVSDGYFDMDAYKDIIKKNFESSTLGAFASMGSMMVSMFGGSGFGDKTNFLSMGVSALMEAAMPKIIKSSISTLDKHFGLYVQHALEDLKDSSYTSDSMVKSFLGEIFGIDRYKARAINMGNYQKNAMTWNGIAQKALVEVIPELLTSIDSTLSKSEKRYMDYETGQFKTKSQIEKAYKNELKYSTSYGAYDLTNSLEKYMKEQALTTDQQRDVLDKLNTLISSRFNGDGKFDENYKKDLVGALGDFNDKQFRDITMLIEQTLRESELSRGDFYKKIGSSQSVYRNLNNTYGSEFYKKTRTETSDFFESIRPGSFDDPTTKIIIDYLTGALSKTMTPLEIRKLAVTPAVRMAYENALTEDLSHEEMLRAIVDAARQNSGGVIEGKVKTWLKKRFGFIDKAKAAYGNIGGKVAGKVDQADDFLFRHTMGINRNPNSGSDDSEDGDGDSGSANPKPRSGRPLPLPPGPIPLPPANGGSISPIPLGSGPIPLGPSNNGTISPTPPPASTNDSKSKGLDAGSSDERKSSGKSKDKKKKNKLDIGEALAYGKNQLNNLFNKRDSKLKSNEIAIRDAIDEEAKLDIPEDDVVGAINASARSTRLAMLQNTGFMQTMSAKLFGENGLLKNIWDSTWRHEQFEKLKEKLFNEKDGVFKGVASGLKNFWGETKEALLGAYDFTRDNTMKFIFGEDYHDNKNYNKYFSWLDIKKKRDQKKNLKEGKEATPDTIETSSGKVDTSEFSQKDLDDYANSPEFKNQDFDGWYKRTHGGKSYNEKKSSNIEMLALPASRGGTKKTSVEYDYDTIPMLGTIALPAPEEKKTSPITAIAIPQLDGTTKKVDSDDTQAIGKEIAQLQVDTAADAANKLKSRGNELSTQLFGDLDESKKKTEEESFFAKFRKVLPKATAGAIIGAGASLMTGGKLGLIGGLFLPGGPLSAAIVGFGVTMLSQTEAFKSLLFGKLDEKTGERYGGLISKDLQASFKKALPTMVGGAVLGALKGMIFKPRGPLGLVLNTLLPGGPIGGALLGLGVSMIRHSDTFKNILFGKEDENGNRTGTWLSKSWNSMKGRMGEITPTLKKGVKGLGIGALTGVVMSHMGVIPAAMSLGGPVGMGLAGLGIGIASASKKFNTFLFGSEEFDENGNPTGKHNKDGFLTRVKNMFTVNVFNPIATKLREEVTDFALWTKQKIAMPFKLIFGPIIDSVKGIKEDVVDFVKDRFNDVTDGIKKMLTTTLKALFSPIGKVVSKVGRSLISGVGLAAKMTMLPLTGLLKLGEVGTAGLRKGPKKDYYKSYYGNMGEYLKNKWATPDENGKKRGLFGRGHDLIDTLLQTNDEYRHMAKDSFAEGMDAADLNSMNWFREDKRDIQNERKKNRLEGKGFDKINKLGLEVNKEYGGREVQYTDAKLSEYNDQLRKIFKKMGYSEDLLPQNSDEFNDLIYHRKKWMKEHVEGKGSVDTGNKIEVLESPEVIKAREATIEYQARMTEWMKDLHDKFVSAGMESAEKTKKKNSDKKKQREQNRIYKRMKAQGLNPEDYGLKYHADVEEVSPEEWADYEGSEEYTSGDFQKWYNRTHEVNQGPTDKKKSSFETHASDASYKSESNSGFTQKDLDEYATSPEFETRDFDGWYKRVRAERAARNQAKMDQRGFKSGSGPVTKEVLVDLLGGNPEKYRPEPDLPDYTPSSSKNDTDNKSTEPIPEEKKTSKIEDAVERIAQASEVNAQANLTNARIQTGGEIDTHDIVHGKITDKIAARFSNSAKATGAFISRGIGNIFGKFRKDKKKEETEAERKAREEAESKQASALGNAEAAATEGSATLSGEEAEQREETQTKNKKSIWGKLLGIGGSILGFGGSVLGKIVGGISSGGLLSKLLIGSFGITAINKLFPNLFSNIGGWMEETAIPWLHNQLPQILGNFTDFLLVHGKSVIENVSSVITTLMPSLVKGFVEIAGAGINAVFNMAADVLHINNKGKATTVSTVDEARDLQDNGYNIRENEDGTFSAAEDYTIYDKDGNPVGVQDSGRIDTIGRAGAHITASLLRGTSDAGVKVLSALGRGAGMLAGAGAGMGIPGIGFSLLGGKVGAGLGTGLGRGIQKIGGLIPDGSALAQFLGRTSAADIVAKDVAAKAARTAANEAASSTAEAAARAGANAVENIARNSAGDAVANTLVNKMVAGNGAELVVDSASRNLVSNISETALTRSMGNGVVSGLSDIGESAVRTVTNNAGDIIETAGTAALKSTDNIAGSVGEALLRSGDNIAEAAGKANKGFIQKVMEKAMKAFDSLANNKTFKKFFEKAADKIANSKMAQNGVIKTLKELGGKVFKKLLTDENLIVKWSAKLAERTGLSFLKVSPLGLIFTAYDIVNGAFNAENLFGVQHADVKMRLVSSLINTLLGIALIGPVIDIIMEIAASLTGVDYKRNIATALYNAISSDEEKDKFANEQAALAVEADIYNELNKTNLSTEAYNDLKNTPWYSKLWNNIKGLWGDNQNVDFSDQVTDEMIAQKRMEMESGGTINALAEASELSEMDAEPEYNFANIGLGNGKRQKKVSLAKAIGYGTGNNSAVYSQKNAKWARYKLGRYPDGQIATMADAGCGPTAMSMVASSITKKKISPLAMGALAKTQGFISDGGANVGLFTVGAANMGLSPAPLNDRDSLATGIASGKPVILAGRNDGSGANTPFTKAGHIVVANGTDSKGNVNISDPSDGRTKKYRFSDLAKQVNHGWAYGVKFSRTGTGAPKTSPKGALGYGGWNDPIDPNNPYINNFDQLIEDADDLKYNSLEYLIDEKKHSKKIQDVIDALYYFGSKADPKHSSSTDVGYAQGYLTDLLALYDTSEGESKTRTDQKEIIEDAKTNWYNDNLDEIINLNSLKDLSDYDLSIVKATDPALYNTLTSMQSKSSNTLDYSLDYIDAYNRLHKTGTLSLLGFATQGATGNLGITSAAQSALVRQNGLIKLANDHLTKLKSGKVFDSDYESHLTDALSKIPASSNNYAKAQELLSNIGSAKTERAFLSSMNAADKKNYQEMMDRIMTSKWSDTDGVVTHNGMPIYSMDDPKWSGLSYNGKSVSDNKQAAAEVFTLASLLSAYTGRAITPDFLIEATYPKAKFMKRDKYSGSSIWDERGIRWSDILNPEYGLLSLPEFYGPDGKPLENIVYKNSSSISNITTALKAGNQPLMMKGYQFEGSTFGTNRSKEDDATNSDLRALNVNDLLKNSLLGNYMLEDGRIDVSDPAMALEQLQAAMTTGIFRPNSLSALLGDTTQRNVPSALTYPVIGIKTDPKRGVIPPLNPTTTGVDDTGVPLEEDSSSSLIFGKFFNKLAAILNQSISSVVTGEAPHRVLDDAGNLLDQGQINYADSGYSDGTIETGTFGTSLANYINNPRTAKDDLAAKAIQFTLLRESSGDYTAVNPNDVGVPSVGLIQFRDKRQEIFQRIADKTSGNTRAQALRWKNRVATAFSGSNDPELIEMRNWMASPEVANINKQVQDAMIIERFTTANIPPAAKFYRSGVLKNPKSILPLADIANANSTLIPYFFKGYSGSEKALGYSKYYAPYKAVSSAASEPKHVVEEMRRFGFWNGENGQADYLSRFKKMDNYLDKVTLKDGGPKPEDYTAEGYGPAIGYGVGGSIDNPFGERSTVDNALGNKSTVDNPFGEKSTLGSLLNAETEMNDFLGKVGNVFNAVTHTITNGKSYEENKAAIDAGRDPSVFGENIDSLLNGGTTPGGSSDSSGERATSSYVTTKRMPNATGADTQSNGVGLTGGPATDWFKAYLGARVSSWFGPRTLNGENGYHYGIDFANGRAGDPIPSPVSGKIQLARYKPGEHGATESDGSPGYGNLVIVNDGKFRHYFGHLLKNTQIPVKTGQRVDQGQTLGYVGDTGNSYGAHLHYEIRRGSSRSSAFDPNTFNYLTPSDATEAFYGTAKKQMDTINNFTKRLDDSGEFNITQQAKASIQRAPIVHDRTPIDYGIGGSDSATEDAIRKLDIAVKTGTVENKMDVMIDIMRAQLETSKQVTPGMNFNVNNTSQTVNANGKTTVKKASTNSKQTESLRSYHDAVARRPS